MDTSRIPRVTRRRFLKETGLTLAAASAAPLISAPFVSRALADTKTLTIVQWSHFVPEYDKWFDNFREGLGIEEQDRGHRRPHSRRQRRRARGRGSLGRIRSRPVRLERRRRRASLPQIPRRRDEPRRSRSRRSTARSARLAGRSATIRTTRPGRRSPISTSTSPPCIARACGMRSG